MWYRFCVHPVTIACCYVACAFVLVINAMLLASELGLF